MDQKDTSKALAYLSNKIEKSKNPKELISSVEEIFSQGPVILLEEKYADLTINCLCMLGSMQSTTSYVIIMFLLGRPSLLLQYLSSCPFSEFSLHMNLLSLLEGNETDKAIDLIRQFVPLSVISDLVSMMS